MIWSVRIIANILKRWSRLEIVMRLATRNYPKSFLVGSLVIDEIQISCAAPRDRILVAPHSLGPNNLKLIAV